MKFLMAISLVFSVIAIAHSTVDQWTDGDGLTWTYQTNRTRFGTGKERCKELGFRLPIEDEFYEAIQYGLFDSEKNEAFAEAIRTFDWIWMGNDSDGVTSHIVANKFEHRMRVLDHERYYALCVKK